MCLYFHIWQLTSDLGTKVWSHNTKHLQYLPPGSACAVSQCNVCPHKHSNKLGVRVHGAKLSMKFWSTKHVFIYEKIHFPTHAKASCGHTDTHACTHAHTVHIHMSAVQMLIQKGFSGLRPPLLH